jgi:hypothetical protein
MVWKPFKAIAEKRKKRLQFKSEKKMWDFTDNMGRAHELFQLCMGEIDNDVVYDQIFATLPLAFMQFAWGKYDHEKHKKPLSQQHMDMEET